MTYVKPGQGNIPYWKKRVVNPWHKRIAAAFASAVAFVLFTSTAASAEPISPERNKGWIWMTQQVCGSSAGWQEQARRNGVTADPWLAIYGKTYDIQCGSAPAQPAPAQPAAQPAPQSNNNASWAHPLPGTCRPSSGGGQYLAPRNGYRHQGIDLGGIEGRSVGTAIHAIGGGTISSVAWAGNAGLQVQMRIGDLTVKYNHLSSENVSVGQWVNPGQTIGGMGSTGNASGPHLHMEIWRNGSHIDPVAFLNSVGVHVGC